MAIRYLRKDVKESNNSLRIAKGPAMIVMENESNGIWSWRERLHGEGVPQGSLTKSKNKLLRVVTATGAVAAAAAALNGLKTLDLEKWSQNE